MIYNSHMTKLLDNFDNFNEFKGNEKRKFMRRR